MPSTTRGPLPSGIYWRRRLLVLSVALVLVLAIGKVLSLGSDGSGGGSASQAAATSTSSFPPPGQSTKATGRTKAGASGQRGKGRQGRGTSAATPTPTPTPTPVTPIPTPTPTLAEPTGPCADDDVYITPTVTDGVAGSPVTITLNLQTQKSAACTWQVTPKTIAVKITSGPDTVWTSQECPKVIPTEEVVVRQVAATPVTMTWDGKRSDEYCTGRTATALPGFYHAYAAPLGGEQTDVQFQLASPATPQVTVTVTPTPTPTPTATPSGSGGSGSGSGKHGGKHKHRD